MLEQKIGYSSLNPVKTDDYIHKTEENDTSDSSNSSTCTNSIEQINNSESKIPTKVNCLTSNSKVGSELAATFAAARNQHFTAAAAAAAATTSTSTSSSLSSTPTTSSNSKIVNPTTVVTIPDSFANNSVENYKIIGMTNEALLDNGKINRPGKKDVPLNDNSHFKVNASQDTDNMIGNLSNKPQTNTSHNNALSFKPSSLQASWNLSSSMKEAREEPYRKHVKSISGGNLHSSNSSSDFQGGSPILSSDVKGKPTSALEPDNTPKFNSLHIPLSESTSLYRRKSNDKNKDEIGGAFVSNKPSITLEVLNRNTKKLKHSDTRLDPNDTKVQIILENNKTQNHQKRQENPLHASISSPSFNQSLNKSPSTSNIPDSLSRRKSLSTEPSNFFTSTKKDFLKPQITYQDVPNLNYNSTESCSLPYLHQNYDKKPFISVDVPSKTLFTNEKSFKNNNPYLNIPSEKSFQKTDSKSFSLRPSEPYLENSSLLSFFPEEISNNELPSSIANLYHHCNSLKQGLSLLEGISDLKSHVSTTSMSIEVASAEEGLRSQILEFQLSLFQLRELHKQCTRMLSSFISESDRSASNLNKQFSTLREQMTGFTIIDSLEYRIESVQAMIESRTKKLEKINKWVAKQEDILVKNKKRIQKFWKFGLLLSSLGLFLIITIYLISLIQFK